MADDDPLTEQITQAIALVHAGRTEEALRRFLELWPQVREGDAFHRCTLAHFMADLQRDPHEELRWDLRALEAAGSLTDERVKSHAPTISVCALYPSLHLNVAEDYRKVGDRDLAASHLAMARASLDALSEDGYGRTIRGGVARLAERLANGSDGDD